MAVSPGHVWRLSPSHTGEVPAGQSLDGDLLPAEPEQALETTTHPHSFNTGIQDSGLLRLMNSFWLTLGVFITLAVFKL